MKTIRTFMFGAILASVLSWIVNHSVWWLIPHFFLNWLYVIYWMLVKTAIFTWLQSLAR